VSALSLGAPPPEIEELVAACLDYVARAVGFSLDFSPETLPVLDHYLASVRKDLPKNPAIGPLVAPAAGAYFGEIVRARVTGFWHLPSSNRHDWVVASQVAFVCINPIGVGYDALYGGTDHDGPRSDLRIAHEDRSYLDQRLAVMPPLPENDFYLLSTRLEVLDVALEFLRAKLEEQGYGDTRFSEADYGF
jgi:hypothetical protein